MLRRPAGDAAGYWLQLVIATALATLGLALDSSAVVIGAMLIAPLMRPIVELAMGLGTGSTPLVFRTVVRTTASVAITVGASTAIAWLLPFHEATPQLLARMAPTILDLFVAAACAVAGAYAVVIASNDLATTAAGTSIGISLVPPLCTAGYGLSVGDWDMAGGAALLFTANVTGIVTVATAMFVLLGFGQVNVREEDRSLGTEAPPGFATRVGRIISNRTSGRLALVVRVGLPLALLAAIAFPLKRAVDEMSQRSTLRQRVAMLLSHKNGSRVVQYSLDQSARPSVLRVVLIGDAIAARALEAKLRDEVRALGAPQMAISVWAVTDASAMSALAAKLEDIPAVLPQMPVAPPPPPPPPLESRLRAAWPSTGGTLIAVWTSETPTPTARVVHLGPELGPIGRELLSKAISIAPHSAVVDETALVALVEETEGLDAWVTQATLLVSRAIEYPSVRLCVDVPRKLPRRREPPGVVSARAAIAKLATRPQVTVRDARAFRITPQLEDCFETATR